MLSNMTESPPNNDLKKSYTKYTKVLVMLFQIIILMLIFTFLGNWIDKKYEHKTPYLTIIGVFVGMGIGFYNMIKNAFNEK